MVAPVVGTWIVLRRMANLGDTMSHGTLAGVGVAYAAGANILLGALGAGVVIAVLLILFSASQRLGHEAIIAVMGSALFAVGIIIISRIDTTEELEHILFGDVLQLTWSEIGFNLLMARGSRRGVAALQRASLGIVRSRAGRAGRRPCRAGASGAGGAARRRRGHQPAHGRLHHVGQHARDPSGHRTAGQPHAAPDDASSVWCWECRRVSSGCRLGQHSTLRPGATIGLLAAVVFAIAYAITLPRRMPHHHRPFG